MFEIDYLRENIDWRKVKDFLRFLIVALVFFSLFCLLSYFIKQNSPNRDDAKLKETEKTAAQITDFPKSAVINEHTSSRSFDACIHKYYVSKASLDEVGKYYDNELIEDGWVRKNQDSMIFRKEDFSVYIERRYEKDADWNFAISVCWKNNQ
jgi:hypothetical protein